MYGKAIAYNYQLYRKEFIMMFITAAGLLMLLLSIILAPAAAAINIGGPSDCDNNAIIRCGAHSTSALISDYNSSAYVRGVYAEFGISQTDMASLAATNVAGQVTKTGNVFIDGQSRAVATGAVTGGRQNIPGSTKVNHQGAIFYKRPPSVSFQQDSLPAFVSMKNGHFQFAVIASCGNAVAAQPTSAPQQRAAVGPAKAVSHPQQKPQQPMPAPPAPEAQTQAQTQSQSQSQEVNVNNTNTSTQITKQEAVPQAAATPTAQPQAAGTSVAAQPATQNTAATLPNTGPTGVVGLFLAAVGLGTLGYRRLLLSRFG